MYLYIYVYLKFLQQERCFGIDITKARFPNITAINNPITESDIKLGMLKYPLYLWFVISALWRQQRKYLLKLVYVLSNSETTYNILWEIFMVARMYGFRVGVSD